MADAGVWQAALNALKYFKEKANDYHVIAAGSLLCTLLAQPKSYPVGMVNLLELHPLYFDEFLAVINEALSQYYLTIQKGSAIEGIFHSKLLEMYNYYLIIGGMPECVSSWAKHKDPQKIALRFSKMGYRQDGAICNIPLYLATKTVELM